MKNYELLLDWKWLRENSLLRLYHESCILRRLWCHFSNFLQRGKTIHCLQVHDILWNHSIIEEKKILQRLSEFLQKYTDSGTETTHLAGYNILVFKYVKISAGLPLLFIGAIREKSSKSDVA